MQKGIKIFAFVIFYSYLCNNKTGQEMKEEITYRTTLNGAQWQIVKNFLGVSLFLKNYNNDGYHFHGEIFRSAEEANRFLDKIDERISKPQPAFAYEIPANYYGVAGRYYGD